MKNNKKNNKDYIKILKYFKNIKFWLCILIVIMISYVSTNIFNPIINSRLITNLTNFNINNAIIYAFLFLGLSLFKVIISRLTDIIFLKKLKVNLFII